MARPPTSYGASVKLKAQEPEPLSRDSGVDASSAGAHQQTPAPGGRRRPMETRSDPTIIYLHPDGKYELKRYALARGPKVKVHDLLIEALEEWAQRHGIDARFRVPSERPRRK